MPEPSDVLAARMGDRDALERLLVRHQKHLARIARNQLGAGLKARLRISDVVQSAFLDAVRSVRDFKGEDDPTFVKWLETLLTRNIQDRARFYAAEKRKGEEAAGDSGEDDDAPDVALSPVSRLVRLEDVAMVDQAMERLSEEHRQVIRLNVIEGKAHKEVAEAMGRTESSCRVLLMRARVALAIEVEGMRAREPKPGG